MGLTTAMLTGMTGMDVNQTRISTIGNNIANVNTTAFKASRTLFETQFAQTLSAGSAPSAITGGANPMQVGLGAQIATTARIHTNGAVETTGVPSDLAMDGPGFFILRRGAGERVFTRDGSFSTNSANQLVAAGGHVVQGFGVDSNFNVQPTVLQDIAIPLGTLSIARATQAAALDGELSADGTIATQGSQTATQALVNGGASPATGSTALTDVRSAATPGVPLFVSGSVITVSGVDKGDREMPMRTFTVGTDGSTLDDFANWLEGALGIHTDAGLTGAPGVTVENGRLIVRSNAGEINGFTFNASDIRSDNTAAPLPFTFTQAQEANGSGIDTAFTIYDSLGSPVTVNVSFALEQTPDSGPVWRYFVESPDATGASRTVGTGTLIFDNQGNFVSSTGNGFTINRGSTGAATPLAFTLDFSRMHGLSTQLSSVILAEQDGYPPGTLTTYAVAPDGVITGIFDNGQTRTLGQVALAMFANDQGLISEADNLYTVGPASGAPTITAPGTFGAGLVIGGALESSNVDLAREFIGLITSSTGFQASSRVISTSNELLNQLLLILQ